MSKIYFTDLIIDQIANNSGLFTGDNDQQGWFHQQKVNEGFGRTPGEDNHVNWNQTVLVDRDVVDLHNKRNDKRNESG